MSQGLPTARYGPRGLRKRATRSAKELSTILVVGFAKTIFFSSFIVFVKTRSTCRAPQTPVIKNGIMNNHDNGHVPPPDYPGSNPGGRHPGTGPASSIGPPPSHHTTVTMTTDPTPGATVTEINLDLGYFQNLSWLFEADAVDLWHRLHGMRVSSQAVRVSSHLVAQFFVTTNVETHLTYHCLQWRDLRRVQQSLVPFCRCHCLHHHFTLEFFSSSPNPKFDQRQPAIQLVAGGVLLHGDHHPPLHHRFHSHPSRVRILRWHLYQMRR